MKSPQSGNKNGFHPYNGKSATTPIIHHMYVKYVVGSCFFTTFDSVLPIVRFLENLSAMIKLEMLNFRIQGATVTMA